MRETSWLRLRKNERSAELPLSSKRVVTHTRRNQERESRQDRFFSTNATLFSLPVTFLDLFDVASVPPRKKSKSSVISNETTNPTRKTI